MMVVVLLVSSHDNSKKELDIGMKIGAQILNRKRTDGIESEQNWEIGNWLNWQIAIFPYSISEGKFSVIL